MAQNLNFMDLIFELTIIMLSSKTLRRQYLLRATPFVSQWDVFTSHVENLCIHVFFGFADGRYSDKFFFWFFGALFRSFVTCHGGRGSKLSWKRRFARVQ